MAEEECEATLRLLLVGGGGDGDTFEGHGGGSGYITYKQVNIILNSAIYILDIDDINTAR